MKSRCKRISVLVAIIVLACAAVHYFFYPNPHTPLQQVSGLVTEYSICRSKAGCKKSVQIADLHFDCSANALGASNSCPKFYVVGENASAEYYFQPSVLTLLTGSPDTPVLIKFEQGGRLVYQTTFQKIQDQYRWPGSMLLIALFCALFVVIKHHSYFRTES
jgi:hypothetical protein